MDQAFIAATASSCPLPPGQRIRHIVTMDDIRLEDQKNYANAVMEDTGRHNASMVNIRITPTLLLAPPPPPPPHLMHRMEVQDFANTFLIVCTIHFQPAE